MTTEQKAPFTPKATLKEPVVCFAVRLDALLRVRPFISVDITRYYMTGVYVHAHPEGGALCVATDGHRIGVRRDTDGIVHEAQIVRLPKELKAPTKAQRGMLWAVMVRTNGSYAHLSLVERLHDSEHDTAENAIARVEECVQRFGDVLIDGTFPNYANAIPAETNDDVIRSFNSKYLASFGKELTIRGREHDGAHLVLDYADPDFVGAIMPMQNDADKMQEWVKPLLKGKKP